MRLFEWKSAAVGELGDSVPDFVKYLAGVWQSRNRYVDPPEEVTEEEQQEERIQQQRFFDFTIDGKISARNYVGVVQFGDTRIEVYPKLFADEHPENTKQWQMNLLYWLSYCRKIQFPFSQSDVSKMSFDDFLEVLIYVFANYTTEVLSNQPFQAYQEIEEETTFLKGRLLFDEYTRNNLVTGRKQYFYCRHAPFAFDNQFNRIVKYIAKRLIGLSRDERNRGKLNELLFLLHDVSDVSCTAMDCEKVKLNPLYNDHGFILELCKLYLSNQVIDMSTEDSRNFCFLIPMEYIFEEFVYGFIADKWPSLAVKSQSWDYLALNNGRDVFKIKNDIYIANRLIIDTKYKARKVEEWKEGVSQADIYQMVSYAIKRNCSEVFLLYPTVKGANNNSALFQVHSPMLAKPVDIHVGSIDITFEHIGEADQKIKERFKDIHSIFTVG